MAALLVPALIFCAPGIGNKQNPQKVPYMNDDAPSVDTDELNYVYPNAYDRIQDVDFENLNVRIYYSATHLAVSEQLKKGKYNHQDNHGFETITFDDVYYLNSDSKNRQLALVLITWFYGGGSSNTDGIAQVFELINHRLKLVQQIHWDEHFDTNLAYFFFNTNLQRLIVRTAHYLPGDSHCCISAMDTVTFRWNGSRFVQAGLRTGLSRFGVRNGKKLVN
ncbi:MAG: hypothetical protein WAM91_14330 [Candidatus Acidiferrales bacterium]